MSGAITHPFEAEVSQVLHLVIHSLYSHKDIFLRELISNASDALDKLRFRAITEDLYEGDTTLAIRIRPDREKRTLTIEDTGVGMTQEELVRELGTVARSGSRAFLEQLAQRGQKDARLIGQFGVGFYSAYLVAQRVDVISRAAGPGHTGYLWRSEGKETFTIQPYERASRGTAVVLHLREDQTEFLEEWRLRDIVKRYSDYVSHPIELEIDRGTASEPKIEREIINRASALWQRPKNEISEEQYDEFYRHLAHAEGTENALARTHFKVEGTQEFAALLYVPREPPLELRIGTKHRGVRLYVKRVLIMEDCEEIVPEWLRFLVGVIDSDDLPLNVSREVLQESSVARTIRKQIVKHVLDLLEEMAAKTEGGDYEQFWKAFSSFIKLGVGRDFEFRDRLAKLLRYESTAGADLASLGDYVKRMKEGQRAIYYVIGESSKALEGAPHLEGLRKRDFEVLLMTDAIDEWTTSSLRTFEGHPLVSAMRADLNLEPSAQVSDEKSKQSASESLKPLFERVRAVLADRIADVRASDRLTDSPCCLVLANAGPHAYVQRLLREAGREVPPSARILEMNAEHPVVKNLEVLVARGDERVKDWIELLYDQALVAEGAPPGDPSGFVRRVTSLLQTVSQAEIAAGPQADEGAR